MCGAAWPGCAAITVYRHEAGTSRTHDINTQLAASAAKERSGLRSDIATGVAGRITMQLPAIPVDMFACVTACVHPDGRSSALALRRVHRHMPLTQRRLPCGELVVRFWSTAGSCSA